MTEVLAFRLRILGATHFAETVIELLTKANRAHAGLSLDVVGEHLADAEIMAGQLQRQIGKLREEIERERVANYDALFNVIQFPKQLQTEGVA